MSTKPVPPQKMVDWIGGGDYLEMGDRHLRFMTELGGLEPTHKVLDVGCGCGRTARALVDFLKSPGSYTGFDSQEPAIDWCRKYIRSDAADFRFEHMDVYNGFYNPSGAIQAHEFVFPYMHDTFDFACLWSVFTHMLNFGTIRYLGEISRILKPGGTCFLTAFLINSESVGLMADQKSSLNIRNCYGKAFVADVNNPEGAVGYKPETLLDWVSQAGLRLHTGPFWGSWCGRKKFTDYQDILVLTKD